jgi:hypothetical protein
VLLKVVRPTGRTGGRGLELLGLGEVGVATVEVVVTVGLD